MKGRELRERGKREETERRRDGGKETEAHLLLTLSLSAGMHVVPT